MIKSVFLAVISLWCKMTWMLPLYSTLSEHHTVVATSLATILCDLEKEAGLHMKCVSPGCFLLLDINVQLNVMTAGHRECMHEC